MACVEEDLEEWFFRHMYETAEVETLCETSNFDG